AATLTAGLALPPAVHATTARPFVQARSFEVTSGTSVSVTLLRPTTPGNLIVAYVVWDNGDPVSLTDTSGNAWASAVGPTRFTGDPASAQIFYARNIVGGTNTVTAHFTTAITTRGALYVHEYAGLDRVSPLGGAVAATGSSV